MSKEERIRKRLKTLSEDKDLQIGQKDVLDTFLIITEGEKTEPNYFKSFPLYEGTDVVEIHGMGMNTKSLVEAAENKYQERFKSGKEFDQKWIVFDKDSFPDSDYDVAVKMANDKGFEVAYSNECFEIWYLLHYCYIDSALSREQIFQKLSEYMDIPYDKASEDMYSLLENKKEIAKKNADKLEKSHSRDACPHEKNPVTYVFKLVKELDKNTKNRF